MKRLASAFYVLLMTALSIFTEQVQAQNIEEISYPSSHPESLTSMADRLYFVALNPKKDQLLKAGDGSRMFKTDGTAAGTVMLKDIDVGGIGNRILTSNGKIFFAANDKIHGEELWVTNGSDTGTMMIKDIFPGKESSLPFLLAEFKGMVLFTACESEFGICGLWRTDGTVNGTLKLKEVHPDDGWGSPVLAATGNHLFFVGIKGGTRSLWKTDCTAAGTTKVKEVSPESMAIMQNTLFFQVENRSGMQLWKSDGTPTGTLIMKEFSQVEETSPSDITNFKDKIFLSGKDKKYGSELWRTDGTSAGTTLVKDIIPGPHGCNPSDFLEFKGILYFACHNAEQNVRGIWKTDGTGAGTVLFKDFDSVTCIPGNLTNNKSFLYFSCEILAESSKNQVNELWRSDGTAAGTLLLKRFAPDPLGLELKSSNVVGEILFFQADDGIHGSELWKTDGSSSGTVLVKDIASQPYRVDSIFSKPSPPPPMQNPLTAKSGKNKSDSQEILDPKDHPDLVNPVLANKIEPVYVEIARKARIQGTVELKCVIDQSGSVISVEVLKPLHPILDHSAIEAVKQWKYKPATMNGKPVKVSSTVTVKFYLKAELTNKEILELLRSGLDEDNLIKTIEAAKSVEFDLSPDQLKFLLAQGVSNKIISAMQKKQSEMSK